MTAPESRLTRFRALLVGNGKYQDPDLEELRGPHNDVDKLREELTNPETGLFECQEPLVDESADTIRARIADFFHYADGDDCMLFYYSGHGRTSRDDGTLYMCGQDTNTETQSPVVRSDDLLRFAKSSPARWKIIILDCCFASRLVYKGGVQLPPELYSEGFSLLAAKTRNSEMVPDSQGPDGLSPFTASLVDALRSNELDRDNDGFVTVAELVDHINQTVRGNAPGALQLFAGSRPIPIARSPRARPGVRPWIGAAGAERALPAQDDVVTFLPVLPGPLPELLPVPLDGHPGAHLGRHLVTNGQFREFLRVAANARWRPENARAQGKYVDRNYLRDWQDTDFPPGADNFPVANVSVFAAEAYASWAGRELGRPLRLPLPAEWESAARGGRREGEWVAAEVVAGRVNFLRTLGEPAPVGEFGANSYEFCDLLGSVWDICVDDGGLPVLQGGAFNTPEVLLRERRRLRSPIECREDAGFRCAARVTVQNGRILDAG